MAVLSVEQIHSVVALTEKYLNAPPFEGKTPLERQSERDSERVALIEKEIDPLVIGFLDGSIPLAEFKPKIDGINKRHEYWGFKGTKGQMFFNMLVNAADSEDECAEELRQAIECPRNEDAARSRIKNFLSYVKRLGEQVVDAGGSLRKRPWPSSVPFFLSYFWQVQDRRVWPVYYTNSVNVMNDMNLWRPTGMLADDYLLFKHVHEELAEMLSKRFGKEFGLYEVEHVFWFKDGNPYGGNKPVSVVTTEKKAGEPTVIVEPEALVGGLPQSYVPPIVSIIPRLAMHDPTLEPAAKQSSTSIPAAFEKHLNAAFTILGYETMPLGQGSGRNPDGLAMSREDSYAIVWDAKVRQDGYSFGTDDRAVREYVQVFSRNIKKTHRMRNLYFCVISSGFKDGYEETVRELKMETDTNEVCLIEAEAIVEMVEAKLRNPLELTLGPDGLQRIFSDSGVVTAEMVSEVLL